MECYRQEKGATPRVRLLGVGSDTCEPCEALVGWGVRVCVYYILLHASCLGPLGALYPSCTAGPLCVSVLAVACPSGFVVLCCCCCFDARPLEQSLAWLPGGLCRPVGPKQCHK